MGKLKARSVELTKELVNLLYRNLQIRTGLTGEDRKEWKRIVRAFEGHELFLLDVEDGNCERCGNMMSHFGLQDGTTEIFIPMTRAGRKLLYDRVIEAEMKGGPALALEKRLRDLAGRLGFSDVFEGLIEKTEPDEDEEFEIVEEDEEDEEKKPDAAVADK